MVAIQLLLEHDLFRKPVPTFRDHALTVLSRPIVLNGRLRTVEFGERAMTQPGKIREKRLTSPRNNMYACAMHLLDANKVGALGAMIRDRTEASLRDLSPSAAAVLSMLHFKPGLTTTEVAEVVGVSQPTAVRLIDGLERQALIIRGKPQGRVTPLTLTETGHAQVREMQALRLSALDGLLSVLQPDERRRFVSMLDEILAGATTSRAFARTTCRLCEHDLCGPEVCPIGCRAAEIDRKGSER